MKQSIKSIFNAASIGALGLLTIDQNAHCYVPPSFQFAKAIAKKHQGIDESRFRSKVFMLKSNGDVSRTLTETLYFSSPETVTVRITDEQGQEIATASRRLNASTSAEHQRSFLWDLLFIKDFNTVFEHFKMRGLPMRTESDLYSEKEGNLPYKPEITTNLARFDGKITVLLADTSGNGPQLWLEKDSLLPLKAKIPADAVEYSMSGFQLYKNFLYPRNIQINRDGKLWARLETTEVRFGSGLGSIEPARGKADIDGQTREFVEAYLKCVR